MAGRPTRESVRGRRDDPVAAPVGHPGAVNARSAPLWLLHVVLAGALSVLLVGGLVAAAGPDQGFGTDVAAGSQQRALTGRLPELIAFVEAERGLTMRRKVSVEVLDDDDFVDALTEGEPVSDSTDPTGAALGVEDTGGGTGDGVLGFYDGATEEIVVRGGSDTDHLEQTVVHELTHAVQDQYFMIDRPELQDGTEQGAAFGALVEGDATRVELAWYASRPREVQRRIDADEQKLFGYQSSRAGDRIVGEFVPDVDYPYIAGQRLVKSLLARGGQQLLDATFSSPPLSSEQVLHPEQVGEGSPPTPPAPKGAGRLVDEGTLGELGLAVLLQLDPLRGDGPQVGWDGDSYRTYEVDDQFCTLATVRMTTPSQRDRLIQALESGTATDATAEADGASRLSLRSCVDAD